MKTVVTRWWGVGLLVLASSAAAQSENLPDPTRPPAVLAAPVEGEESGPVLQSVTLSPSRKAAMISGQLVPLGGKYGDAVLIRLTESEAVLKKDDTLQTLKLFPGVDKRLRRASPPSAKGRPNTKTEVKRKEK